ncbi:DUF5320 domain-containing protein [bacterium]|nr:DUF5320 domain-containing protein [bacterium]
MPRGDRRGPDGMGPMTGRGMGYCAGFDAPGFVRPSGRGGGYGGGYGGGGYGYGGGRRGRGAGGGGYGRGYGGGYGAGMAPWGYPGVAPVAPPVDEASSLTAQAEYLEEALKDVRNRISALEEKE